MLASYAVTATILAALRLNDWISGTVSGTVFALFTYMAAGRLAGVRIIPRGGERAQAIN
jgi:hypothetical protein